ncbi:MAG: MFS transporter [Lachnospiraceae bacterium]|jgi:Na+/melibiose symporter-like transporter|nr:MFS transporter [Lachnospiraceae bacterium]
MSAGSSSKAGFRTSRKERISFALFMAGQTLFNQFFQGYSKKFMTEMGLTAAVVGTILLSISIFDAVDDPFWGNIFDRAHFKSGKFLPWLRISVVLMPIFSVALFLMPKSFTSTEKVVWGAVFAVLFSIAYTLCDAPIFSMISAVTDNVQERVQIMSTNAIVAAVPTLLISAAIPFIYPRIGWGLTGALVAAFAVPLMIAMGLNGKERFVNKDPETVTLKATIKYLKENKYLRIYFIGLLILFSTSTTAQAATFFADFNLGNVEKQATITLVMSGPALLFIIILPFITKKIDKFKIFLFCVFGQIAVSIISFFAGYENQTIFLILIAVRGLFWGGNAMMMLMFTPDFIEYGEFKTGKRLQGTVNSIQTFICKLMTAIAGGFVMFIMSAAGFKEGVGVVQPQSALDSIWFLISFMPAVGGVLSLPFFLRYKLNDKDSQLMASANSGEITRQEAQSRFIRKY